MSEKSGLSKEPSTEVLEDLEKIKAACGEMPAELSFKGIRKKVLENVWKRANEAEKEGIPLTHENFSQFLREEWDRAKGAAVVLKAAYERCRGTALKGAPKKPKLSKDEIEERIEYFFATKKAELKNDLGIKE